jgi:two-component system phosphate regulon sensor histidine kinase PhoR
MTWVSLLLFYVAAVVIATVLELFLDSSLGWMALAVGGGTLLIWRRFQATKVAAWLKAPSQSSPPKDVGPWVDVVDELHRYIGIQQELLKESQETTAAVMAAAQALPVGVIALDRGLDIIWFNRAGQQHLELDEEADIGKNLLHFIRHPEFVRYARQSAWPEPITQTLHQGKSERIFMMQLVTYARDQRLLIIRDVTQIDRLERTRRDFVANVSHELRTPLTVLAGFLETIREAPTDALKPEQKAYYLDLMQDQANRMQSIVSDLLILSDLENNPNTENSSVDVAALLSSAGQQAQALSAGQHGFEWHIEEGLKVWGNPSELASAFSNLLTNAVHYTPAGGTITVRWHGLPGGGATYSVSDTGIGIASEHIPRLSERFYRVDRGRSRSVGGTGLGLAITKHIAIRHEARLEIESRLGQGSTFSLVFGSNRITSRT